MKISNYRNSDFEITCWTGRKGKKKKGKTLNLNEFLSTGDSKQAASFAKKKAVDIEENEQNPGMLLKRSFLSLFNRFDVDIYALGLAFLYV